MELELELKKQGKGALFLDAKLYVDDGIRQALNTALYLLHLKRQDVLIHVPGNKNKIIPYPDTWQPILFSHRNQYGSRRGNDMQNLLNQFKVLTDDEKLAFMKEAMPYMAEIFGKNPQKMMAEMMPVCMKVMKSKGMDMDRMRSMRKGMMG